MRSILNGCERFIYRTERVNENYFTCDRPNTYGKELLHMKSISFSLLGLLLRRRRFLEPDDQSRSCCVLGANRECIAYVPLGRGRTRNARAHYTFSDVLVPESKPSGVTFEKPTGEN